MNISVHFGKLLIWGGATILVSMTAGNILYMNPLVKKIFDRHKDNPCHKPMDFIGGQRNWVLLTMGFGFFYGTVLIALFVLMYDILPGGWFTRGMFFAQLIWLIKAVPEAFNQWMMFKYPGILIVIQLVNSLIGLLLAYGLFMPYVFEKFGVIQLVK